MIYVALLYSLMFVVSLTALQFVPKHTLSPKTYRYGIIVLILMLSYVASQYIPLRTDDLYRYYILIERMRNHTIKWAITSSPYLHEPFSNFLFLFVAKCTKNNSLFPTLSVGLIYGIFFCIVKEKTNFRINKEENLALLTFLTFNVLLYSISGTRNTMAAMFFAYGLVSEKNKMTIKSFLFYLLSICTHIALFPIVVLRFFCEVFSGKRVNFIHILALSGMAFAEMIIKLIANQELSKKNLYIRVLLRKVYRYLTDIGFTEIDDRYVIAMLSLCLALLVIYLAESKKHRDTYTTFMGYLICMTLGLITMPIIFERYVRIIYTCMLPMMINLRKEKWMFKQTVMHTIMILDIGMLCYQVVMFYSHFDVWFF